MTVSSSAGFASATAGSAIVSVDSVGSSTGMIASATAGAFVSSAIVCVVLMWHGVVLTRKGGRRELPRRDVKRDGNDAWLMGDVG